MSWYLDKVQDNNVLQWVYTLWFAITNKESILLIIWSVVFKFVSVNETIILMQIELPRNHHVLETDYELQNSES